MIAHIRIDVSEIDWEEHGVRFRIEVLKDMHVVGRDEIIPYEKLQLESFFDYLWNRIGVELKEYIKKDD